MRDERKKRPGDHCTHLPPRGHEITLSDAVAIMVPSELILTQLTGLLWAWTMLTTWRDRVSKMRMSPLPWDPMPEEMEPTGLPEPPGEAMEEEETEAAAEEPAKGEAEEGEWEG